MNSRWVDGAFAVLGAAMGGAVIGATVFGSIVGLCTGAGAAVVVAGAGLAVWRNRRAAARKASNPSKLRAF